MALIDRTIFPRMPKKMKILQLNKLYTPSRKEIGLANSFIRGDILQICVFLIMMKVFQNINYFINFELIPEYIVNHIKDVLGLSTEINITLSTTNERTIRRYKNYIRKYLNIESNKNTISNIIDNTLNKYEPLMENTADIVNAVIESLLKSNCEIPSFNSLERMIANKRTKINNNIFKNIGDNLNEYEKQALDLMLIVDENGVTNFNYIKELPKSSTLIHLRDLKKNYTYLEGIKIGTNIIKTIAPSKLKFFAAQANALDASEMKDFTDNKRYTLLVSFISYNTIKSRDNLITMFIKRIAKIHNKAKEKLENLIEKQRTKAENIIETFHEILLSSNLCTSNDEIMSSLRDIIAKNGGYDNLLNDCEEIRAYNNKNYYPLLWSSFKSHRKILFEIIKLLSVKSTTENDPVTVAIEYLLKCEQKKSEFIPADVDISFVNDKWQKLIKCTNENNTVLFSRKYFEICMFSYIASSFKSGDLYVLNSEEFADYREQLLPWEDCEKIIQSYCDELTLPSNKTDFINSLKKTLAAKSENVDKTYPLNKDLIINSNNEITLKKNISNNIDKEVIQFRELIEKYMPERNIMEILCNVEHWINYTKHFGSLSGSEAKFKNSIERYILLVFGYGSNMGPTETSKHVRGNITPHMIHFTNKRHVTEDKLDRAIADIVNCYNKFYLPKLWGDSRRVAADGTKLDVYTENLLSEYHIRYGGFGGIAYHHVSDTYVALFSHFIPCGVWEAVYIIDGLLKNKSNIKPGIIHADTQGQSTPVFALTYLLGIKLMPRIRNWKDLKFFRFDSNAHYENIDALFKDTIKWDIIENHYKDLFQVALSINAGKILPSTLLRKLNNYSRKNKLYQAFRELGNVIRTIYLLDFISDSKLRTQITESTNKTESYNGFSKWFFFGGDGIICENDLEEQSKIIKYNDLLSNAVILQNTVDINYAIEKIKNEKGIAITRAEIKALSPYMTSHIKRFGEYIIDLDIDTEPMNNLDIESIIE